MLRYGNIPDKYIRVLARSKGIKIKRGKTIEELIRELEDLDLRGNLEYLDTQFKYMSSASALTICKPEHPFVDNLNTPEKFIEKLISDRIINKEDVGRSWQPALKPCIQICGIEQAGSDIYIMMVEEKTITKKQGYGEVITSYAHLTSAVIHFSDQVIQVRCGYTQRDNYVEFLMNLLGFNAPYEWIPLTKVTKDEAKRISELLSAGLASTQVLIPSSVGSLRFDGRKGIDLRSDNTFSQMKRAIESIGIPTDDTLDEICFLSYLDPTISVEIEVSFEINLRNGGFRFLRPATENAIDHVLDAFIQVCYVDKINGAAQTIAASES